VSNDSEASLSLFQLSVYRPLHASKHLQPTGKHATATTAPSPAGQPLALAATLLLKALRALWPEGLAPQSVSEMLKGAAAATCCVSVGKFGRNGASASNQ